MWYTSVVIDDGQVLDLDVLQNLSMQVVHAPPGPPRSLLVHVLSTEDTEQRDAYTALTCMAMQLDRTAHAGQVAPLHPVSDLSVAEQVIVRTWLIQRRWPAWARADSRVRALLGAPDAPVLLAEAARHWMIPLPTLAKAALTERVPTIRVGDRQLVYLATIAEAQQRGLLHQHSGRPKRAKQS